MLFRSYAKDEDRRHTKHVLERTVMAAASVCDVMIMSALGCGAFKRPVAEVAAMMNNAVHGFMSGQWYFAVMNDHNTGMDHNPDGNASVFKALERHHARNEGELGGVMPPDDAAAAPMALSRSSDTSLGRPVNTGLLVPAMLPAR